MKPISELNSDLLFLLESIEDSLQNQEMVLRRIEDRNDFAKASEFCEKSTEICKTISQIKSKIYTDNEYAETFENVVGLE